MSKGNWKKHGIVNQKILELFKEDPGAQMTTRGIRDKLNLKFNVKISWKTLNNYLNSMVKMGHIKNVDIEGEKNTMHFWMIRGLDAGK